MDNYSVYITKINDIQSDLQNGLGFIGWEDQIQRDSVVFVKPNFTYPFHKPGITTTPKLLEVLLGNLKDI